MKKKFTTMLASAAALALILSGCQTDKPAVSGESASGADGSASFVSSSQAASGSVQSESQLSKNELCFMDDAPFTNVTKIKRET